MSEMSLDIQIYLIRVTLNTDWMSGLFPVMMVRMAWLILIMIWKLFARRNPLQWRHNGHKSVSNHMPHDSVTIVFSTVHSDARQRKHQSPASLAFVCGEFTGDNISTKLLMASNAENVSIWWRHHERRFMIIRLTANNCKIISLIRTSLFWERILLSSFHWYMFIHTWYEQMKNGNGVL